MEIMKFLLLIYYIIAIVEGIHLFLVHVLYFHARREVRCYKICHRRHVRMIERWVKFHSNINTSVDAVLDLPLVWTQPLALGTWSGREEKKRRRSHTPDHSTRKPASLGLIL